MPECSCADRCHFAYSPFGRITHYIHGSLSGRKNIEINPETKSGMQAECVQWVDTMSASPFRSQTVHQPRTHQQNISFSDENQAAISVCLQSAKPPLFDSNRSTSLCSAARRFYVIWFSKTVRLCARYPIPMMHLHLRSSVEWNDKLGQWADCFSIVRFHKPHVAYAAFDERISIVHQLQSTRFGYASPVLYKTLPSSARTKSSGTRTLFAVVDATLCPAHGWNFYYFSNSPNQTAKNNIEILFTHGVCIHSGDLSNIRKRFILHFVLNMV